MTAINSRANKSGERIRLTKGNKLSRFQPFIWSHGT